MELLKLCCYWVFVVLVDFTVCYSGNVVYRVTEEDLNPVTLIGNVGKDFNLSSYIKDGTKLRFSLSNNPHVSHFNISEETGNLYTTGVLDRETICEFLAECNLPFVAIAVGLKNSFYKKLPFVITIVDKNDHAPEFLVSSLNISFSEAVVVGTARTIEGATDPDGAEFTVKSYSITPPSSPFSTNFSKNYDGTASVQIIVNEGLNREKQDHYQLTVVAIDGGSPPKTGTLTVNIIVNDANDNFPTFTLTKYNTTVKEDIPINSTILQVTANDEDIGENGQITYKLASHQSQEIKDLFVIDAHSGVITSIGRLVYSPGHQYQIIVEASDAGSTPHTTQAIVYVNVQDVENNPPTISINRLSSSQFAKVSELANPETMVALIEVSDMDVGWNGITNCSIVSSKFSLQKSEINEYKVVVADRLDRETQGSHNVTVFCHDSGTPPLNSSASFVVMVIDENDHKPNFTLSTYRTEIYENNTYGIEILTVSAFDNDDGDNGRIRYELQGDAFPYFTIDPTRGIIKATQVFDREEEEFYHFHVLAIDHGKEPWTSTATVSLTILDINDNIPKFNQTFYEFEIAENQSKDQVVGQVVATDKDTENNGIITYSISENYEITVPFRLAPDGKLLTKKGLDREMHPSYNFTVVASDQGSPHRLNSSVSITVFVTDLNDHSPFFVTPDKSGHPIYLSISTRVNTPLYLVLGHDVDTGRNAELTYIIEERNDTQLFDINDSGQILVARPIEKWEIGVYMIQVAVYDNGKPRNFAKTRLLMYIGEPNITDSIDKEDEEMQSQNLLIALTVVIVTVVLAATIVVTIFVIRRMDKKKRDFFGADTNSDGGSVEAEVVPGLVVDGQKGMYSRPSNTVQLAPVISHLSLDNASPSKDYVYKPRMNTPTPSHHSAIDGNDGDFQLHSAVIESQSSSNPGLNRLASLRLHQALLQSHDKQWTNHDSPAVGGEIYTPRQSPEDCHSQMSGDGDSGRGGSVSDGPSNMGLSHDADDPRILQLQNIVRQSGRRGAPPHMIPHHKLAGCQKQSNLSPRDTAHLSPRDTTHLSPRDAIHPAYPHRDGSHPSSSRDVTQTNTRDTSHSSVHFDPSIDNRIGKSHFSNSNSTSFLSENDDEPDVPHHCDMYRENTASPIHNKHYNSDKNGNSSDHEGNLVRHYHDSIPNKNINVNCSYPTPSRGKSSPGIQMGLSSITSHYAPSTHRESPIPPCRPHTPHRRSSERSCDNVDKYPPHVVRYPVQQPNNLLATRNRFLDETMDSVATTAYDDDDNTTTSGSYTIDNNAAEDFVELNVAQLKDMFV